MRLIDAEWIKDRNSFVPKQELHTVEEFLQILDEAPAIDAVRVVRCRECKYSDTFTPDCTEATFPLKCLSIRYGGVYPDWYCEHGERKDGDGDE